MRILAIDDELDILKLIEKALKSQYQVDTIHSPEQAIPEDLSVYNLIITDVMMPHEDGFELIKRIRGKVSCPIIFLSAKALEEDVIYGLSLGADDYLRKPFSVAELRARIGAHIRRDNRDVAQAFIEAGGISLYPEACEFRIKEETVEFTKSEFEIARLLFRNRGQVFSKAQIYEIIYGYDKDGDESAITEHIKNVRRKLKKHGTEPIETVWGIGYKWKKQV
ncbi:response regulator transcription factor [Butyrivibrio sp.]|uniref:response regulator transcription factor n=1 Tax=Butyrivibrio sp. TaxID=28121 RepID=UPI002ED46D68